MHFQSTILGRTSQASIETLHLSGNRIQHFDPKLTSNLIALKHLHLAENDIHQIPAQLPSEYAQLLFLNLSSNALQTFPDHARQLFPSLIRLDISNNLFSSFSISILHNFINHLDQVYLYNNPWDCGCLIDELKRHMSERYGYRWELRYEHARCATPEDLHGAVILRLNHISDCAVLFGARYGLSQANELSILFTALVTIALVSSMLILLAYYRRESQQKKINSSGSSRNYMENVRESHSRTALTLSQVHMCTASVSSPSSILSADHQFNESVLSSQQLGASSAIGTGIGYGIGVRIGGMTTAVPSNLDSPICALSSSTPRMPPPPPPPILATF